MAKTVNEQFQDILLRRNIALASFERGLTSDVLSLLDDTEQDIRTVLTDRLASIEGADVASASTTARLGTLVKAIEKIRSGAMDDAASSLDSAMQELSQAEVDYLDQHLSDISPVQLDMVLPDPTHLASIVTKQPIQGRLLSDWFTGLGALDSQRISDAINIGMAQGEPTQNIIRRVIGTKTLDGTDGVLEMTRSNIAALTQTSISTVANEARQQYYSANSDVFDQEQWVATLDASTCPVCGALDGHTYAIGEGPQPPQHFNCRCVRVPVIDGGAIGTRPANAAFADELDGLSRSDRIARVKELVGQVPASVNYEDWLAGQTSAFQDHVLGPTRGRLFRGE